MLLRQAEEYQNQPPIFKNDNLTEAVQEIRLSVYNYEDIETKQINFQFIDKKSAKAFCEELPEACPVMYSKIIQPIVSSDGAAQQHNRLNKTHPLYLKNKSSSNRQKQIEVSIILSEQISKDLEKIYGFLSEYMSEENLNIIKNYAQPRTLSRLEQEFYTKLNNLTLENLNQLFNLLLKDAKEISEKERGIQVNALWALAMRCKEIEPLEDRSKFVEALSAITEDDNYYKKAQREIIELGYYWITFLNEETPNKRELFSKIITSTILFIKKEPELLILLKQAFLLYSGKTMMDESRNQASELFDGIFNIAMKHANKDNFIIGDVIIEFMDYLQNTLAQTTTQSVSSQPKQEPLMFSQPVFTEQQLTEIQEHCSTITASVSSYSTDEPSPKKAKQELKPSFN